MIFIDVREKDEFKGEHVPESISCPLSDFNITAPGLLKLIQKQDEVTFMCRTGKRAELAIEELRNLGADVSSFKVYEGGMNKWVQEGNKVIGQNKVFPIMRQVQIGASLLIILAFIASYMIHPNFKFLALFVGVGLGVAGFTGLCPMAMFLHKMPWNKSAANSSASSNKTCCN